MTIQTNKQRRISDEALSKAFYMILFSVTICIQSGCATIMTGTFQRVEIDSMPSGADVFVNGNFTGITPCEVDLDQGSEPHIVLKKENYECTRVELKKG